MSEHKKEAKASSAAKLQRMGLKLEDGSKSFTDERGGSPFEGLNSGNAGQMPVGKQRFKRGGKVAHVMGEKAHKNLGKSTRRKREDGGGVENATGPNPVPVPPRKNDKKYNPFPYLPTKKQIGDQYAKEHPDSPTDLGASSSYARGGTMGRKQAAAIAYKKKGAGMSPSINLPKMSGLPNLKSDMYVPRKSGGSAKHTDEAQDKKLMHKVLKEDAFKRPAKASGGLMGRYIRGASLDAANSGYKEGLDTASSITNLDHKTMFPDAPRKTTNRLQGIRTAVAKMGGPGSYGIKVPATDDGMKKGGRTMHHKDCSCKMCSGGMAYRSKKFDGGGITGMNPMMQRPGTTQPNMMMRPPLGQAPGIGQSSMGQGPFNPMGNRPMRASGGRAKGKTNVNIIISPQSGQPQGPLGAGVGMGQPPVPPMMPPTPPMGGMPPGMPPMMPPAPPMGGATGGGLPPQLMAALAGRGGMPPMPRKSGGRVGHGMPKYQEEDYGSGSGLGRLEKRKWPTANGTE